MQHIQRFHFLIKFTLELRAFCLFIRKNCTGFKERSWVFEVAFRAVRSSDVHYLFITDYYHNSRRWTTLNYCPARFVLNVHLIYQLVQIDKRSVDLPQGKRLRKTKGEFANKFRSLQCYFISNKVFHQNIRKSQTRSQLQIFKLQKPQIWL